MSSGYVLGSLESVLPCNLEFPKTDASKTRV